MTTQQYSIVLALTPSPEVLERVLRVSRHRGFNVTAMNWDAEQGKLEMTVTSQRALHLLMAQLDKLIDVKRVEDTAQSVEERRA